MNMPKYDISLLTFYYVQYFSSISSIFNFMFLFQTVYFLTLHIHLLLANFNEQIENLSEVRYQRNMNGCPEPQMGPHIFRPQEDLKRTIGLLVLYILVGILSFLLLIGKIFFAYIEFMLIHLVYFRFNEGVNWHLLPTSYWDVGFRSFD